MKFSKIVICENFNLQNVALYGTSTLTVLLTGTLTLNVHNTATLTVLLTGTFNTEPTQYCHTDCIADRYIQH